jgi:hypothetical protein
MSERMKLLDVPPALWAYALLRSLAFAAPSWAGGSIGLGVVVVAFLYVYTLRRSRRAWSALVILDGISLPLLVAAWLEAGDAAVAAPILAVLSIAVLVLPATRRYVSGGRRAGTVPPTVGATASRRVSGTGATG